MYTAETMGHCLVKQHQSYTFFYSPYQTPKSPGLAKTTLMKSFKPIKISAIPLLPHLSAKYLWLLLIQSRPQKPARPMQEDEVIAMNCLTRWKFSCICLQSWICSQKAISQLPGTGPQRSQQPAVPRKLAGFIHVKDCNMESRAKRAREKVGAGL